MVIPKIGRNAETQYFKSVKDTQNDKIKRAVIKTIKAPLSPEAKLNARNV
jgi:hypothetical protein